MIRRIERQHLLRRHDCQLPNYEFGLLFDRGQMSSYANVLLRAIRYSWHAAFEVGSIRMMRLPKVTIWALALLLMLPLVARGQGAVPYSPPQNAAPSAAAYTQQQLDQLTAPIALYPDPLVAQILMAATYPLEIVEASRWLQNSQNAQLHGNQLTAALEQQPWDPSVKSLVGFPQVLSMMDKNLQWTEQLGDAFLAQQAAVMDSVQRLRHMAQDSGHLASTPQQTVSTEDDSVIIEPANPEMIYVPYYNPLIIYGPWPYPDYEPYYFPYPVGFYCDLFCFGAGIAVVDWLWGWNRWDWHHHRIGIDDRRFEEMNRGRPPHVSSEWEHDPAHRYGVPYTSPATRAQFQGAADQARLNFRGFAPQSEGGGLTGAVRSNVIAPESNVIQRAPAISTNMQQPRQLPRMQQQAPVFESFSRGADVRVQSQRGAYSRSTTPAAPMRSAPSYGGGRSGDMRTR
jgi:hypothetical protein